MTSLSSGNITDQLSSVHFYKNGIYVSVYDSSGTIISGAIPFPLSEPFSPNLVRNITYEGNLFYLYDASVSDASGAVYWIRGVTSADSGNTLLNEIVKLSLFVLPLIIVLGTLGGYLVSYKALAPVRSITEAANAISGGDDLSLRIALGNPASHDELQQLSDSFDSMFERLEKSFASQQQFTSSASHELRTPTTVIIAECDYLQNHASTPEDYRAAVDVISRQAHKMSQLIESLLAITRIDLGTNKAQFEVCDLSEMVEIICEETSLVGSQNVSLITDIEPELYANIDVSLMSRLLQNLIDNAYKYNKNDGFIKVALHPEGQFAVLSVEDNGIGIPKEQLELIWNRFYRVDSSSGDGSSLGLGLSLVRQIAALHNADLSVTSTEGKGSTFYVKIPLAEKQLD